MSSAGSALWHDVARWLAKAGVTRVCGSVGEGTGLLESAVAVGGLDVLAAPSPKVATHAAHGIAIAHRQPVAVWVPAGPGIAGAVPALLEAHSAAARLLVLCPGTARGARDSGAFQHVDVQRLVSPLARFARRVELAEELPDVLSRALRTLRYDGGPAVVEIPADLTDVGWLDSGADTMPFPVARPEPSASAIGEVAARLDGSARPLLVLGGGCDKQAGAAAARLATDRGIAVLTTAAGRGTVAETEPFALGNVGLYMPTPVRELVGRADLVLAVGTALEETARWSWADRAQHRIVQLGLDEVSFGRGLNPALGVVSDAAAALRRLHAESGPGDRRPWLDAVARVRDELFAARARADGADTPVRAALLALQDVLADNCVLVLENGLSDMWAYNFPALLIRSGQVVVAPAEQTGLGFAVPAAAGIAADQPSRQVVAIIGDGAFRAGQDGLDLLTAAGAGAVLVVIENGGYGWPRLEQRRDQVNIGCDLRVDLEAEVAARWPGSRVWRPAPAEFRGALGAAARHARAGQLGVVGVRTDWDRDLPDAIRSLLEGQ